MANIFGQSISDNSIITTSYKILPQDISSEAEALILMSPPVQIFETNIFKINPTDTQWYKNTLLYKRYIDAYQYDTSNYYGYRYNSVIKDANAHVFPDNSSLEGTGNLYIPFMRCMLYCEYSHIGNNEDNWKNNIIFGAQGYQNQNIGRLNPNNIGNPAKNFNKSPSEETIMYTVNVPEKESGGEKAVYSWYYSTKTSLQIQYNPNNIFIEDLKVVAF